jgi:isoamylase
VIQSSAEYPLGASLVSGGAHFAVFSSVAEKIELCLFDASGAEKNRIVMSAGPENIWRIFVPGITAGILYGYRVYGTWAPERGLFCDGEKILLDPHARSLQGYLSVVTDNVFEWQGDILPRIPFAKTVVYEAHVRGLTKNFPDIPEAIRGTYLALAHEKVVGYLKDLGVTTLELLPVHAKNDDAFLLERGLTNYWGYSTLSFFSPEPRYASRDAVAEFKTMVRALHRAGIEVILDVVYNHTAEMGADGPVLSWRGLDNRAYYLFDDERGFIDHTGCGNTLNVIHPQTRRHIIESLRYWAEEMHVDGFRFDLAPALFREGGRPVLDGTFARAIVEDPVLSQLKLIAEPWDLGPEGYVRDSFRPPWKVWNDRFRNAARRFWRGDDALGELFQEMQADRAINYVTCHDGFTLRDLVSYKQKHNAENREENRDGADENFSENHGVEGDTDNREILETRLQQSRNLLATLLFTRATPMLLAGDELGHSQNGNNNAYCQDNAITHLQWGEETVLQDFIRDCLNVRARFDWDAARFERFFFQNSRVLCLNIYLPGNKTLLFLANPLTAENAVVTLPDAEGSYRELINTARPVLTEPCSGIFIVPARGLALLEA